MNKQKNQDYVTLINVYSVDPANQEKLLQELIEAAETIMKSQNGFIGSRILKSRDGKSVTVYAHWERVEDAAEVFRNPKNVEYLKRIAQLGSPNPSFYDSAYSYNI